MPTKHQRSRVVPGLLGGLLLLVPLSLPGFLSFADPAEPEVSTPPDPLAALGFEVTGGAAPGYVEDRACALCHNDLWRSYQEVGMARSFARPEQEVLIEAFGQDGRSRPFHHAPSDRWYQMQWRDGTLTFRRWLEDEDGDPVHLLEQKVDWIMGSGHTSRVYLYQTDAGELFQLPLAWYSQDDRGETSTSSGHWGMAPGFDRPDHSGVQRQVRRECMFCHNAYPDVPVGSDGYGEPHLFPADLPQGTGCQRCHGPGADHVRTALVAQPDDETLGDRLRDTIVNPSRLSQERRDDVCFGCHLQPTVAVHGVRRFGRGDYSFRPGQALSDYVLKVDIDDEDRRRQERFEINHHAYRLLQSSCFQSSRGNARQDSAESLSCLTCHDPHRKVPAAERLEHYRRACLSCHTVEACQLEQMGPPAGMAEVPPGDCITCHMPRRRTQDVVQVVMTDHRIQRRPPGPDRLAALAETTPTISNVELLEAPEDSLAEVYRIVAFLRAGGASTEAVRRLGGILATTRPDSPIPYLDLAKAQLKVGQLSAAEDTLRLALARHPDHEGALSSLGILHAARGDRDAALLWSRRALAVEPRHAPYHFNLGRLLLGYGKPREALPHLRRAVEIRPVLMPAWVYRLQALTALGEDAEARSVRDRMLRIDPSLQSSVAASDAESEEPTPSPP